MATEIERKFLVVSETWRAGAKSTRYRQGYLSTVKERTVRVRSVGDKAYLTVKGLSVGASRAEYEYEIPLADAGEMLERLCEQPIIDKTRHVVVHAGLTWEIDEFYGANHGLIVAEVELKSEDQAIDLPSWAGDEVTGDSKYFNSNLIKHPFTRW